MDIQLRMTCQAAPVQYEGTITTTPGTTTWFYFRARNAQWRMSVAPTLDDAVAGGEQADWEHRASYGELPYDASWMPPAEAEALIRACAERYGRGEPWPDDVRPESWVPIACFGDPPVLLQVGDRLWSMLHQQTVEIVRQWEAAPFPGLPPHAGVYYLVRPVADDAPDAPATAR